MKMNNEKHFNMKQMIVHFILVISAASIMACGQASGQNGSSGERTITTSTVLTSSSLAAGSALKNLVKYSLSTDCGEYDQCVTPANVSGKIYYSGIMVGDYAGYSLGPIVGDDYDPSDELTLSMDSLEDFDFDDALAISGEIECCGGSDYPEDDEAITTRIESLFGYIDFDFSLTESDGVSEELVGDHTVRVVYATIDDTEYEQGDVLYSNDGEEFFWCTFDEGCVYSERPVDPIQYEDVADYDGTDDGLGNQNIPSFAVQINEDSQIEMTEDDVLSNDWTFTIDFDMGNGIAFAETLDEESEIVDMVSAFRLLAEPWNSENPFTADLDAEATPIEE